MNGLRYLNLTGLAGPLGEGRIRLRGRHCRLVGEPTLWRARHPDYRDRRVMVIAPHADDAELAAFGLYSQAREAWIVTLTAGEIETEHYRRMGLDGIAAARLKGRLRAWDSQAVPAWGGVPAERCVQLGYFCLQLPAMQANPGEVVPSREADLADIRPFRQFNRLRLASDADGLSTWNNLLADLRELILLARPRLSSCLIRISIRTRTMSAPKRPCARRSRVWTGSRRHCCTMPITCTTTIAGRWAMRTWGSACRR
ncbi:GlcNAc-PI de-N-acetylase [Pseudomonas aeruginosa]|nr:GlcNAc-PI de-N-acetylase [Pseudomonas aeruginosa]